MTMYLFVKDLFFCEVFCLFVFFLLLVLEFGVLLEHCPPPKKTTVLGGFFYIKLAGVAEIHVKLVQVLPYALTRQTHKLGLEGASQLRRCVETSNLPKDTSRCL